MGDGKKLKEILNDKNKNVKQIASETGIRPTTLYSIIQKDSNIRLEYAMLLANALNIDVNEICSNSPLSGNMMPLDEILELPSDFNEKLDSNRIKTYIQESIYPLMTLFGVECMADVDNLLTSFYQLDDEARHEILETIQLKMKYHKNPERTDNIKKIKKW